MPSAVVVFAATGSLSRKDRAVDASLRPVFGRPPARRGHALGTQGEAGRPDGLLDEGGGESSGRCESKGRARCHTRAPRQGLAVFWRHLPRTAGASYSRRRWGWSTTTTPKSSASWRPPPLHLYRPCGICPSVRATGPRFYLALRAVVRLRSAQGVVVGGGADVTTEVAVLAAHRTHRRTRASEIIYIKHIRQKHSSEPARCPVLWGYVRAGHATKRQGAGACFACSGGAFPFFFSRPAISPKTRSVGSARPPLGIRAAQDPIFLPG